MNENACEMCVQVVEVAGDDPFHDAKQWKRGFIIEILPVGSDWGKSTLTNPNWKVIRIDMTIEEGREFMAQERDENQLNPMLPLRMFRMDLDALDIVTKGEMDRKVPKDSKDAKIVLMTAGTARTIKVAVPVKINPFDVGEVLGMKKK